MYLTTHKSNKGTKAFGLVAAGVMTVGFGLAFASMNVNAEHMKKASMELFMLPPPPPPPPLEKPDPPKVEVKEEVEAAPAPPPLVAPPIEIPVAEPVITAPVADPVPVPDPVPVAPSPPAIPSTTPKLIAGDKPDYPSAAKRAGEHGTTHLRVCVNSGGRVTNVSVAGSSGSSRLDDAALKWIRGERFRPGTVNGVAQDVCGYSVYYEWNLRDT
jgi:protein TonB